MVDHPGGFILVWIGMMLLMMAPATAFLLRAYAALQGTSAPRMIALAAGYLGVWTGVAIVAGAAQSLLVELGFLEEHQRLASRVAAGTLLAVVGVYQLTPLKDACAQQCRAPRQFLETHWREGAGGALRMGALHGLYCVGCCGLSFAALFALGVASMAWMAALLAIILAERVTRFGPAISRATGAASIFYAGVLSAGL